MTELAGYQRKHLRGLAHSLKPVVQVGASGVTDSVLRQVDEALGDHELIKVRLHTADREQRAAYIDALGQACEAEVVQKIGKIVVLYRSNPEADPRLSNLHRAGLK